MPQDGDLLRGIKEKVDKDHWARLIKEPVYSTTGRRLEEAVSKAKASPKYNVFKIQENVDALASQCDLAVALSREAKGLQAEAIKRLIEYESFLISRANEELIELNEYDLAYAQNPKEVKAYNEQHSRIVTKWGHLRQHQEALEDRHSEPGGALNYSQRFELLRDHYLLPTIDELVQRAIAVREGLTRVLGLKLKPLPLEPDSVDHLERLVSWTRETSAATDAHLQKEVVARCSAAGRLVIRSYEKWGAPDPEYDTKIKLAISVPDRNPEFGAHPLAGPARLVDAEVILGYEYHENAWIECQLRISCPQPNAPVLKTTLVCAKEYGVTTFNFGNAVRNFDPTGDWTVEFLCRRLGYYKDRKYNVMQATLNLTLAGLPR